ncbi:cupin domain-containing protein [Chitinophaga nivalis]|uniref:Cupin domain-containing protein n=1 Tax=Chitinophaga nivalis TaxID=2991709 RepID=A0ABT3INA4_9BACT|nr:cupin domain-containing protein [Chitinophaga nivalis]MCW3464845.1 cupin domain-containing protein [Chitinophaga nivalis]MCW3485464.1 cupin domain-containing protein [Chitinophaga nivalis]
MDVSRRGFMAASSVSAMGLLAAATGINLMATDQAKAAATGKGSAATAAPEPLEDFIYDIEHGSQGWEGAGGTAKEATVEEFPVSQSIAGVLMMLKPGAFRELHWHSIAAEWAYVLEGRVRTTVISPDGTTSTDIFEVGDIWYFPKGHGHCLECLGDKSCKFILGFDSGHFSEFGTFSLTDWMGHLPPGLLARDLATGNLLSKLPARELYIGTGKIITDPMPANIDPHIAESYSSHKFRMETDGILQTYTGGFTRLVSSKEFPIQSTLTALRMDIKPGAMRELHWHPNADEWQYVISGEGNVGIFGSHGRVKTMSYSQGKVAFIKQGFGHYIENTGKETLKLVVLFNSPFYEEISLSTWLKANPPLLVAEHFGITAAEAKVLINAPHGIF